MWNNLHSWAEAVKCSSELWAANKLSSNAETARQSIVTADFR